MGVNASISQISGGIATAIAGLIVHQAPNGQLENYTLLGIVVAISMVACEYLIWGIFKRMTK